MIRTSKKAEVQIKRKAKIHPPSQKHFVLFLIDLHISPNLPSGLMCCTLTDAQSACLRRKAGISTSSMPPEDMASTRAEAPSLRGLRQVVGTARFS